MPRFESATDPEHHPARDFGHFTRDDHGRLTAASLFLEDRQASVELVERGGLWFARIEDFDAGTPR